MSKIRKISFLNNTVPPKFDGIAVDSCRMRIPLCDVEVIDPALQGNWLSVNDVTGEIDEKYTRSRSTNKYEKGYKVRYGIENMNLRVGGKKVDTFLTIALPSKTLEKEYLTGITKKNIGQVYDKLQSQGVAKFSKDVFMNSVITDIDLKQDFIYEGDFRSDISEIYKYVNPSKKKEKGARLFKKRDNQGIEFGNRKATTFKTTPYLKVYHKGLELLNKSQDFAAAHLGAQEYQNIVRVETTIKNRKHISYLWHREQKIEASASSLEAILSLTQEDMKHAFDKAIEAHIMRPKRNRMWNPDEKPLSGRDLVIYTMIKREVEHHKSDFESLRESLLMAFEDRKERSRMRKFLNEIHAEYLRHKQSNFWPLLDRIFWN